MATTLKKIKVKFKLIVPAENKNDFVAAANDEDGQQILASDYVEEYGLSPVDNSYFEDDPNREVHSIDKVEDENGKSLCLRN